MTTATLDSARLVAEHQWVMPCLAILDLANTYGEHVLAWCCALPGHDGEHDWNPL